MALLVLMALIGTAFIVTARTDRTAARIHTRNVQGDMAVQSAVNLVLSELTADLLSPQGSPQFKYARDYRPPPFDGASYGKFENWDAPGDAMIASRVPVLLNTAAAPTSLDPSTPATPLYPYDAYGINPPVWINVSSPPSLPLNQQPAWSAGGPGSGESYAPTARPYLGHPLWPHLQVYSGGAPVDYDPATSRIDPVPAADADGDGIADALLWKLPTGPSENVTYYAAVRVVDNNSAVNVNTALSRDFDFDGSLGALRGPAYFLGRVGLAEMLRSYKPGGGSVFTLGEEFLALNVYRNNSGTGAPIVAGVSGGRFRNPVDDAGNPRPDFQFVSLADALQSQLGRRIGNPGASTGQLNFRAFTPSDSMALGYRFCLADATASPAALERVLDRSLFQYGDSSGRVLPVPTTPYGADEATRWIERFRYDLENPSKPQTFRDLRALLVARNPVANQAPAIYATADLNGDGDRNDTPAVVLGATAPMRGGRILMDSKNVRPYEGIQPLYVATPGGERVRSAPPVPINTAGFPELWRGFWSVMTPDPIQFARDHTPLFGLVANSLKPYYGGRFFPPNPALSPTAFAPYGGTGEQHSDLMFRSSIRDPRPRRPGVTPPGRPGAAITPLQFEPGAQILLRSALAAVNTEDLRDADDDVTSHLIELSVMGGLSHRLEEKVPVRVYGIERQPYLTEVYVNTDDRPSGDDGLTNPKGYVAIEFHNPYPADINVGGWSVGLIGRAGVAPENGFIEITQTHVMRITNLDGSNGPPWRFPPGTVVPAGGHLVLENYDPDASAEAPPAPGAAFPARHRPLGAAATLERTGRKLEGQVRTVYVPNLHRVVSRPYDPTTPGGEFVLLRTRKADGTITVGKVSAVPGNSPIDPPDPFDEGAYLADLIPVDQFDFTTRPRLPRVDAGMKKDEKAETENEERLEEDPDEPPADDESRKYTLLHYVRANGGAAPWRFVYPGRYYGRRRMLRQQGTVRIDFGPTEAGAVEPLTIPPVRLGAADPVTHPNQNTFPIPLALPGFGGDHKVAASGNAYPFGLFARQADLLQVPFIGAYTVYAHAPGRLPAENANPPSPPPQPGADIYEMNGVSMDSVFAEDTDPTDDPPKLDAGGTPAAGNALDQREQVGRFCPVFVSQPPFTRPLPPRADDFGPPRGSPALAGYPDPRNQVAIYGYRYRWAVDLFEHFSIHAPHNDFLPNVAPSFYRPPPGAPAPPPPQPVSNSGGVAGNSDVLDLKGGLVDDSNDYVEDRQPVEGLVNINTAPWKVLAALPMVLGPNGAVDVERNIELAKAIVYFRDVDNGYRRDPADRSFNPHGPFKTIFELNEVVETRPLSLRKYPGGGTAYGFRNAYRTLAAAGGSDFAQNYEVLSRISNLITTRSDSFTCYVYVMGVAHDGAPDAEIKVQRRVAFIADRSGVRPLRPVVRTLFFGND